MNVTIHPSVYHHSIIALLRAYTVARSIEKNGRSFTFKVGGLILTVKNGSVTIHSP